WDNMPPLAPPLIEGVLRQGHKMLISGPSKAGKSFAQIEMAIAIAEGARWMGWKCSAGKVVYVNFELDRPSCLHRFADVYAAMGLKGEGRSNIEVWNLRGQSMQLDKLAPKLIRRALRVKPMAIILDPIYKTLTGDENSAEQMAIFCNQFDRVCTEVGCSVIYCHHHSKGAQGGKKVMDRASGSGVFARDPDALLDLIELPLRDSHYDHLKVRAACRAIIAFLDQNAPKGWRDDAGPDDFLSKPALMDCARKEGRLSLAQLAELDAAVAEAERHADHITAWRISCTLREYERPDDRDVYFSWPVHVADDSGALKDIRPEIEVGGRIIQPRDKSDGSKKETKEKEERQAIIDAYTLIASEKEPDDDGMVRVTVQDFVEHSEEYFGKELKRASMYKKLRKFDDFTIEDSIVVPAENEKS
ncbi:MAG: AAA family ATPase, partial [Selenomonadaceae bacterium]|nr:AAA family ATPase [Selenomonadaceae bacterium]